MLYLNKIPVLVVVAVALATRACYASASSEMGWDDAYFLSGGKGGIFTTADIGTNNAQVAGNAPNGADPSCGAKDPETLALCTTGDGKAKYGVKYAEGYLAAIDDKCSYGSCCIQLVDEDDNGKVAALEHGPFGAIKNAVCSTSHYDKSLGDSDAAQIFANRVANLTTLLEACGSGVGADAKNYTAVFDNENETKSCLISTSAFTAAGVKLPGDDGEVAVSNGGIAIAWGHGLGDGGCGGVSLVQQGNGNGNQTHANPGNTMMLFQIGTRSWSGEWSDTISATSGYLRAGSNTKKAEADSQSCLQPRFRPLSFDEVENLLQEVCGPGGCAVPKPDGECTFTGNSTTTDPGCEGQSKAWCDAATAANSPCVWTPNPQAGNRRRSLLQDDGNSTMADTDNSTMSNNTMESGGEGGGDGDLGFECKIPDVASIRSGNGTIDTSAVCQKYKNATAQTDVTVPWVEIAEAWKAAGNSMEYCAEAIIIAGGECQVKSNDAGGCSISLTGASGFWQVDSARGGEINLFNPCENARAVYDQIVRDPESYDKGCYTGPNGSIQPPLYITGAPPGGGAGGADDKYYNTSGTSTGNCNWLGPFCHWQTNRNRTPPSCCAWTGGANPNNPSGFPYYYMRLYLTYSNVKDIPTCPGDCAGLAELAFKTAQDVCDSVAPTASA